MKIFIAFASALAAVYVVIGLAEISAVNNFFSHLKQYATSGPGQIPWPAIMILLAIGVIGFLGIRRRRKKT